jgi:aryl-alcohol dehydrogenase-like predicted oxidoreductase
MAKIGLGTVQFGMNYGISNKGGKTSTLDASKLLQVAIDNHIDVLDTASAYGSSESALGKILKEHHRFKVVTKIPPLNLAKIEKDDIEKMEGVFKDSLKKLCQNKVYGLLLHNADDLLADGGFALFNRLQQFKSQGLVKKIGVSVYHTDQVENILTHYKIDLIQLPINVMNQSFLAEGYLSELKSHNVEIHVRSVFLQGLLLMPLKEISNFFAPILPVLKRYHGFLKDNALTPVQGALSFIQQIPELDVVVLGVNNASQLLSNIKDHAAVQNLNIDFSPFTVVDEKMINPSLWDII